MEKNSAETQPNRMLDKEVSRKCNWKTLKFEFEKQQRQRERAFVFPRSLREHLIESTVEKGRKYLSSRSRETQTCDVWRISAQIFIVLGK